jgi:hypothetical protein
MAENSCPRYRSALLILLVLLAVSDTVEAQHTVIDSVRIVDVATGPDLPRRWGFLLARHWF